ncbi:hypothetical protein ACQEVB_24155 [Pseudonocardia sp. CA-107938]|uniref:hypothetical protein n=1 Tax=Pseudonocardia sp. CA-107938 TaxID=3240021 RepID=UPI003D913886
MTAGRAEGDCLPCSLETADPATVVFCDELWSCEIFPGYEVPGWFVLRARRHVVGTDGLDDDEAATYGVRLRDLTRAVRTGVGAERVYAVVFGEQHPHFHTLVIARPDAVTHEHRSAGILALRAEMSDPIRARAAVLPVARAYRADQPSRSAEHHMTRGR